MLRRSFIRQVLGAGSLALLPTPLLKVSTPTPWTLEPWAVDPASKVISWTGASDQSFTVLELHRYLMDLFDEPDMLCEEPPTMRSTDTVIEVIHGWTITPESMEHLHGGSLKIEGDVYSSIHRCSVSSVGTGNGRHYRRKRRAAGKSY